MPVLAEHIGNGLVFGSKNLIHRYLVCLEHNLHHGWVLCFFVFFLFFIGVTWMPTLSFGLPFLPTRRQLTDEPQYIFVLLLSPLVLSQQLSVNSSDRSAEKLSWFSVPLEGILLQENHTSTKHIGKIPKLICVSQYFVLAPFSMSREYCLHTLC